MIKDYCDHGLKLCKFLYHSVIVPRSFAGMSTVWNNVHHSFETDSVGNQWTWEDRQVGLKMAHSGAFYAIIVCQWSSLISCKARKCSAFKQGITSILLVRETQKELQF